ncbi:MAG: hypothetical protein AAFX09_13005 [Pseudomonadota bacterium]
MMISTAWWRDFHYEDGVMHVKKTGAEVPVEPGVVGETLNWMVFHARVEVERRRIRRDGPRIWFAPDRPRPWYLIWPVVQLAGFRQAYSPEEADLGFFFEDLTESTPPLAPSGLPLINADCPDVSKSAVGRVFQQVTGRALKVDPTRWDGPMVGKSERNGAHDGRIESGPRAGDGLTWQRLVDNTAPDGCVEDLRCPTVGGEIDVVYLKRRPLEKRFENHNSEVRLLNAADAFSDQERDMIRRFCAAMKLEWGGLDVLRDRRDGALWIVDVNKTDMGPPIALSISDKLDSTRRLGTMLRRHAERIIAGSLTNA